MRWFCYITIILFYSCKSLQPAIGKQASSEPRQPAPASSSSPKFIENITINPSGGGTSKKNVSAAPVVKSPMADNSIVASSATENLTALQFKYSVLIDVSAEELNNLKLLEYIDEWYGTRYRFGGNTKSGIDCSAFSGGLMAVVFGVTLPRMAKDQFNVCQRLRRDQLREGDLVFFHTTRRGVSHVGIYLSNSKFVHASTAYGVTISDLDDAYYMKAFVGGGRPTSSQLYTQPTN